MSIIGLIAAYHEDPRRLAAAIASIAPICERVEVIAAPEDERLPLVPRECWHAAEFTYERAKRNALLALGRSRADWLLMIDADELLQHGETLPLVLADADPKLPAWPLLRQEPDGRITQMPCKLLRGDVESYIYLDIGVRWRDRSWDLDPVHYTRPGLIFAGWPHLLHLGSRRVRLADGFYREDGPFKADWKPVFPLLGAMLQARDD